MCAGVMGRLGRKQVSHPLSPTHHPMLIINAHHHSHHTNIIVYKAGLSHWERTGVGDDDDDVDTELMTGVEKKA